MKVKRQSETRKDLCSAGITRKALAGALEHLATMSTHKRKVTALEGDEVDTRLKQNKSSNEISYNVPVYNKWGALQQTEEPEVTRMEDEGTSTLTEREVTKKRGNLPPIVITMPIADVNACNKKLKGILGNEDYMIKYSPKQTKVITYNKEAYDKVINELKNDKATFFTYKNRDDREKKVVLRGAPNMNTDEIKMHLNAEGAKIIDCIPMKGKRVQTDSYLITATKDTNIGQLKKISSIDHLKVSWETYNNRRRWSQCHRCQNFGHGSRNCYNKPRCVKCAGDHLTNECSLKKTEGSSAKCCNCQGSHPANYSKCPKLLEYLDQREKRPPNYGKDGKSYPTVARITSTLKEGVSYARAATQKVENNENETFELINEFKKLNELCNINNMLQTLRQLNERMRGARKESEKFLILQEVLSKLDG